MKKILCILALSCVLVSAKSPVKIDKIAYLEAMYGFGAMLTPQDIYLHEAQVRVFFPTDSIIHEILARGTFSQNTNKNANQKYNGWEAEYRLGMRMDEQFSSMGMIMGSAYVGLGYQNIMRSVGNAPKTNLHFLYIPIGFWGEDTLCDSGDICSMLTMRYGINTKMIVASNNNAQGKFKGDFLFGGKIYLGLGVKVAEVVSIFAQGYFQYNAPIKNTKIWGFEAGVQFWFESQNLVKNSESTIFYAHIPLDYALPK